MQADEPIRIEPIKPGQLFVGDPAVVSFFLPVEKRCSKGHTWTCSQSYLAIEGLEVCMACLKEFAAKHFGKVSVVKAEHGLARHFE